MTPIRRSIPLLFLLLFAVTFAYAQSGAEVHIGFGSARAKSIGAPVDLFGDGTLYNTPALGGLFMNLGGSAMLTSHFGFGGELSIHPAKADYAGGLTYRPLFYDFNGIYQPVGISSKVVPELQAGIGGMNLKFYYDQSTCNQIAGCSSYSSLLASSNHFQVHFGGGLRFFVTDHVFIRPQVDVHWVHNLFQFGTNWVPQYGASVGYEFGSR